METRNSLLVLKLEAQLFGIVAQVLNACNLKVHPVLAVEDLGTVLGVDRTAAVVTVQTSTNTGKTNTDVDGGQVGLLGSGRRGRGSSTPSGLGRLRRVLAEALLQIARQSPANISGLEFGLTCFRGCA